MFMILTIIIVEKEVKWEYFQYDNIYIHQKAECYLLFNDAYVLSTII